MKQSDIVNWHAEQKKCCSLINCVMFPIDSVIQKVATKVCVDAAGLSYDTGNTLLYFAFQRKA